MTEQELPDPQIGINPTPAEGWGGNLTPYEHKYIEVFGARPNREGWLSDGETHSDLDRQAASILARDPTQKVPVVSNGSRASRNKRASKGRKRKQLIGAAILVPALLASIIFISLGAKNTSEIHRIEKDNEQIERLIDEL